MKIVYKNCKELPNDMLREIFIKAGWSDGTEDDFKKEHFNAPFLNSTLVFSAWDDEKLVGVVRVISDKIIRSIIQDLAVLPDYQNKGIGSTLLKMCINEYPKSEWLIPTNELNRKFYEKFGFKNNDGVFLYIPCKWF